MSLSDGNVVQENSGTATTSTSQVATLPSGTTAGNTVVIVWVCNTGSGGLTPATGFALAKGTGSSGITVWYKSEVAAGETSWTFTTVSGSAYAWYAVEMSNVDPVDPVDATAGNTSPSLTATGGTRSTATTALNAGLSTMVLSVFGVEKGTAFNASWDSYTNGSDEVTDVDPAGSTGYALAVARKFTEGSTGTFETTATVTHTSGGSVSTWAAIVAFRAADAPIVAPLAHLLGFEWGTHGGANTTGVTSMFGGPLGPVGTFGTNYLIQAGSARSSSYGLRVVQSAGAAYVRAGSTTAKAGSFGFNVRVVSATGTVVVAEVANSIGTVIYAQLLYDSSATQFGVRCSTTGTTQWQSGTTALNTWVWIDWRMKVNASAFTADWRIETATDTYTDQTQATFSTAANTSFDTLHLGANASQTATFDFDDVIVSRYYVAYPLGPHQVRLLTVDPGGTPSVSGTTTNFSVFTANTTLGAWNATNARNAVDEVPPTISAAADGVTQTAAAASDYIEFPMDTYACTATEFVNGVRMLAPLWSGSGAGAGDLAIRGHDGTLETALATASQITPGSATAISATVPVWRCAMWQSTNGWTQTELNAAALRVGFSGDATPDMGVHTVYLEVAVGRTRRQQLFGDFATTQVDPTRLGVVSIDATAPESGDASLYYEEAGSPTTVPVTAAATITEQINAALEPDTNYIAWYPPPEGVPDA